MSRDIAPGPRARAAATLVIDADRREHWVDLAELWRHREIVLFLVWRDFKVRYRQTALGIAWAVIQPLLTALVMTMLFARLAKIGTDGVPYPLFVLAGLAPWYFFTHGVSTATMSMVSNQDLVKRIYFPRLAIPLAAVLSGLADLAVSLILLVAALLFYGWSPSPASLLAPAFLLLGVVVTLGVGLILCAANVQYRDVGHAVPFALQIALFLSPIAYPSSALPGAWRLLYSLNPVVGVVDGLRWSLFGAPLDVPGLTVSLVVGLLTLAFGALYLRRVELTLADIL